MWETLGMKDGILYRVNSKLAIKIINLYSPFRIKTKLQLHNNRTAGHLGRDKTISSVKDITGLV